MDLQIQLLTLDRLPLPSLRVYAGLSALAASCSLYYIWSESQLQFQCHTLSRGPKFNLLLSNGAKFDPDDLWYLSGSRNETDGELGRSVGLPGALEWASQQPHCVWPLVNLSYCLLIILSHWIQKTIFGNLRSSELENMKDQFWNLIFYKVVFIFGVVNVQEVEDAVGWCFFVSVIGFLQLARQLSKERHNYLILMNDWSRRSEIQRHRILGLLVFIFMTSVTLFLGVCGWYANSRSTGNTGSTGTEISDSASGKLGSTDMSSSPYNFSLGLHNALFMVSEIGLLGIQTLHALTICVFEHLKQKYQRKRPGSLPRLSNSEDQSMAQTINYYFDITALLFDLVHHVHMLICCNLFLSMTSLIVSLQMRSRARQIHALLKKRNSFTWLSKHIAKYPDFVETGAESREENCAICWDLILVQKAKVLPCKHIFHVYCLKKWLLISMNCPTCRFALIADSEASQKEGEARGRSSRVARIPYDPIPDGFWGFLQTGQTLLDLFGGWDPQMDEAPVIEASPPPRSVSLFGDFVVQDWTVEATEVNRAQTQTITQTNTIKTD